MHGKTGLILSLLAGVVALALLVAWFARPDPIPVRVETVARGQVQDTVANTKAGTQLGHSPDEEAWLRRVIDSCTLTEQKERLERFIFGNGVDDEASSDVPQGNEGNATHDIELF